MIASTSRAARAGSTSPRSLRAALAVAVLLAAPAAQAQFPISQTFMNATAPGWSLLGNATLTAQSGVDPAGAGWLRLTPATINQAGSAIYNTAFASSSGIAITFDYADYGGSSPGADGFSFYLIDGATTVPTRGSDGGALGYSARFGGTAAQCANGTQPVSVPGVTNGYVGIGFDEYGNFSACESGYAAPGQAPQSVVIRGSGSLSTARAFRYLTGQRIDVAPFNTRVDGVSRAAARKVRLTVLNQRITVWMDFGAGYQTVIGAYNLATATNQAAMPATFKMGFSGATGSSTNVHEIRNVRVDLPANITLGQAVSPATVSVGGTVTFTITISNDATNASPGSQLTDAFPAGLSNVSWTATTTGGASVGRPSGTGNLAETVNLPKSSSVTYTVTATAGAAGAGTTLSNTVTLAPPPGVANLLTNTVTASVTVSKMGSSTALTSSANPSVFGQPVTLTATVSAVAPGSGSAAGTATFFEGATSLGACTLVAGACSVTGPAFSVGSHTLTATYGGSGAFNGSTSPGLSQVVDRAPTVTTVTSGTNPSVFGQPVTLAATVAASAPGAGTPGGTVTFFDGATSLGACTLAAGGCAIATSALPVAWHAITASYAQSPSFAASTSPGLSQLVDRAATVTSLTSSLPASSFGDPLTLTATVAAAAPGAGALTGTVEFFAGGISLGTAPLGASGHAALPLAGAALAVGTHALTARFLGDTSFAPSTALPFFQLVGQATPSVALTADVPSSVTGQPITFTLTVAVPAGSPAATGTVTFHDGTTVLGTCDLSAGSCTLVLDALAVGDHAITASYAGDASNAPVTSAPLDQPVGPAATDTALAASAAAAVYGEPVTFTATVTVTSPGTGIPGGEVTFSEGTTTLGTGTLDAAGVATLELATLPVGAHELVATYGGDPAFALSLSPPVPLDVSQASAEVTVGSAPNPSVTGQEVTFTVHVAPVAPSTLTPGGTVALLDGISALGGELTLDAGGDAGASSAALAPGPHLLSAAYAGVAGFAPATSAGRSHQVDRAPTALALTASPRPAMAGEPVHLVASVSVPPPGAGAPSGTVTFLDGTDRLGTAAVDASGQAALEVAFPAGPHLLSASYDGDLGFLPSSAAPLDQEVVPGASSTILRAAPSPSTFGEAITLTATVAAVAPAGSEATGLVGFTVDGQVVGSAPLAGGVATLVLPGGALPGGAHEGLATYGGDANLTGSGSGPLALVVTPAPVGLTAEPRPGSALAGQPITLVATATSAAGVPSGAVTFTAGGRLLGTAPVDAGGAATLSVGPLPVGPHAVAAAFGGSESWQPASAEASLVVNRAPTALALAAAPAPSSAGQLVLITATVTVPAPGGGTPTGLVSFTADGAPLGSSALDGAGRASLTTTFAAAGPLALAASWSGDEALLGAAGLASHQVIEDATTVALVSSRNPSRRGRPITFTAQVSALHGLPTGAVTFKGDRGAGPVVLGTGTVDGAGRATLTTRGLVKGTWAVTAAYQGDGTSAPGAGALAPAQVVENTPPVAGAGSALTLGGPAAPGSASLARIDTAGGALDQPQVTVELWARAGWSAPGQVGPAPTLVRLGAAGQPRWRLGVSPDRQRLEVTLGATSGEVAAPLDGAWHHLALVGGAAQTTLVVDGVEVGRLLLPIGGAAAADLTLGEGFVGELDEVRIWSVARTPAELGAGARRALQGDEPGLVGLWRLDEGRGLELFDASPSALDGVISLVVPGAEPAAPFAPSQAWRLRRAVSGWPMTPADAGYDADGDPLTLTVSSPPGSGTATADGGALQVGYRSEPDFAGEDQLTFTLDDGGGASDYALLVTVEAPLICQASSDCHAGHLCLEGACVPAAALDLRAGSCGCGSGGGGALVLWSALALLLARRTPRKAAGGRAP